MRDYEIQILFLAVCIVFLSIKTSGKASVPKHCRKMLASESFAFKALHEF